MTDRATIADAAAALQTALDQLRSFDESVSAAQIPDDWDAEGAAWYERETADARARYVAAVTAANATLYGAIAEANRQLNDQALPEPCKQCSAIGFHVAALCAACHAEGWCHCPPADRICEAFMRDHGVGIAELDRGEHVNEEAAAEAAG